MYSISALKFSAKTHFVLLTEVKRVPVSTAFGTTALCWSFCLEKNTRLNWSSSTVKRSRSCHLLPRPNTICAWGFGVIPGRRTWVVAGLQEQPLVPQLPMCQHLALAGHRQSPNTSSQNMVLMISCGVHNARNHLIGFCASLLLIHMMTILLLAQRKLLYNCVSQVSFSRFLADSS